jgi:hypothetical protein
VIGAPNRLEPPLVPRNAGGINAIPATRLADGLRQIVPYGAFREMKLGGDFRATAAFGSEREGQHRVSFNLMWIL